MILVSTSDLGRQYAGDPVFSGLALEVRAGERIGLVGTNGAGKTTLMRIIAGRDGADYGSLFVRPGIRVSLLQQQPDFAPGQTLREVARSGLGSLLDLQRELEEAAHEMAEAEDKADRERATRRYGELHDRIEHQDAYSIDHRIEEILTGLGFKAEDFDRAAGTFSGGQQSRMMLAKLLLESPDLMLLDEPSNHLDIESTAWLENYLARQAVAMIVVSHDRYFLDKVVTRVWELHRGKIEVYPGNYTQYWRLRTEKAKVLERQYEKQQEYIADQEAYIRKYAAGQRAKQAHDREKKLARVERIEKMHNIVGPRMGFDEVERSGDIVIEARDLTKGYGAPLFQHLNLSVLRGQCVGVMGPNGSGKTTLLRTLIGRLMPDSGSVKLGHKVQVGYYDQSLDTLPAETPVVRAVWPEDDPDWVENDVRDLLARFGLSGEIVFQTVGQLSGGEKSKAALTRLAASGANLMVMDEPTNHLDIWSREALERSIREFEGSVLVVSHDRYFLNQVADRLVVIGDGKVQVVEGDYETYQRLVQAQAAARAEAEAKRSAGGEPAATRAEAPSPAKRKRQFPYRKAADIEREIGETEREVAQLEEALGMPSTWRDPVKARDTQLRYDDLKRQLTKLYAHWEEALELNA